MFALPWVHSFVVGVFVALLIAVAVIDFRHFRIPNSFVLTLLALYPFYVVTSPAEVNWPYAVGFSAFLLVVGACFFAARMMGGGDVKLMAVVGLWAAPQHAMAFLLVTFAGAVAVAIVMAGRYASAEARKTGSWSLGSAVANLRHVPILNMSVPYGVGVAAGGLYIAGQFLAV